MPTLRYVVVDVFTDTALAGNQLVVFTDARGIDDELMQALALETGMGIVAVEIDRDESGALVFGRMTQPVPSVEPYPEPDALLAALGVSRSQLPIERYDNGVPHTFVALESPDAVAALRPDFQALADLGVKANCFAGSAASWKTRMFARRSASTRTRRQVPQPGRSPATSAGTGSSSGASGSRSRRASRSGVRRRSSRGRTAARAGSSACSAGPRGRRRARRVQALRNADTVAAATRAASTGSAPAARCTM